MKFISLIVCIIFSMQLLAQEENLPFWDEVYTVPVLKNSTCSTNSAGDYLFYGNLNTWIPRGGSLPLQNSPTKVVQLNFNVFQKTDGSGNFQNTEQDRQALLMLVDRINQLYGSIIESSDPYGWVQNLPNNDSKILFDLGPSGNERIYFYQDDALYNNVNSSSLMNAIRNVDPNRMNQLNILFTEGYYLGHVNPTITITNGGSGYTTPPTVTFSPSGAQATAQITNGQVTSITLNKNADGKYIYGTYSGGINSVKITLSGGGGAGATATCFLYGGAGGYAFYPSSYNLNADICILMLHYFTGSRSSAGLAHELGHNLNLIHPFETSYCNSSDYLSDIYGATAPGLCPLINKAWEINPFLVNGDGITNNLMCYGPEASTYLSPMQVGIMHRSLSLTSARKYVADCYSSTPLVITKSETWDFDIRLYRDIVINSCGEITIGCRLLMPTSGKIIVNDQGKLELNGNISTNSSQSWQGIVVNNGGLLELSNTTISNYDITIKSGGTLAIPYNAYVNIANKCKIEIESGAYICIEEGANINLSDPLSAINLRNGYQVGINPSVILSSTNCTSDPSAAAVSGSGSINKFSSDLYLQNQIFTISDYLTGFNIFSGTNVTTSKPQGPVIIQNGANVVFDAEGDILLDEGFEVQTGSSFEAK